MTQTKLDPFTLATVINKDATLADGARAAGDYDNSTNLALWCTAYLRVQWNTTAPSAGAVVGSLYVLPGDGGGTETFPAGGDGTVGSNHTPAAAHRVGQFETVNPSTSADEVIVIEGIPLGPATNRFVFVNSSGQEMDATWQLDIVPQTVEQV